MELGDVVRRRKMVRTFVDEPVDRAALERILSNARRGPSAGFTQGVAFLVLEGEERTGAFWHAATGHDPDWPGKGLRAAPVLILPFSSKQAYLDRYAEPDKGWTDRDEAHWPAPFWDIDAAFATMLMLLTVVDEGLGALFFGLYPETIPAIKSAFGVPDAWDPIGGLAIGRAAAVDPVRSSADSRPRRRPEDVVRWEHW